MLDAENAPVGNTLYLQKYVTRYRPVEVERRAFKQGQSTQKAESPSNVETTIRGKLAFDLYCKVPFTLADIMSDGQEVKHVRRTDFDLDCGPTWHVRPNMSVS